MDVDDALAITGILLCCYALYAKRGRGRKFKTRPINRRRNTHGFFHAYFLPMKEGDPQQFFKYTRMSVPTFNKLLKLVTPYLLRKKLPDNISPEERLAITLQ